MPQPVPLQISGSPPPASDCRYCAKPYQGLDLTTAGRHPKMRGTQWLRHRKLGKLRVCRHCERLWSENYDSRERYTWFRDYGAGALEILAEDSSARRIIDWTARSMPETAIYWTVQVLMRWLHRHPQELQQALDRVLAYLAAGVAEPTEMAALRRHELLKETLAIVEIAAQQLPADGPAVKTSPEPDQVAEQCRRHQPGAIGHAYLGRTPGVMWELAWQQLWRRSTRPAGVLLRIDDITPLLDAGDPAPLTNEDRGYLRGVRLDQSFETLNRLREVVLRPGRERCLAMPTEQWQALDRFLDPVKRMAETAEILLSAVDAPPARRLTALQECTPIMERLGEHGARLDGNAIQRLDALLVELNASEHHPDRVAISDCHQLVHTLRRQLSSDCTSNQGECAH